MSAALVFISYVREDRDAAGKLARDLRAAGLRTWVDFEDILPGERWQHSIRLALDRADFIVVLLSKKSVQKRGFAQREIRRAVHAEEEMLEGDIFLIPVRLDSCEVPAMLSRFHFLDLPTTKSYESVVEAVIEGCRRRNLEFSSRTATKTKEYTDGRPDSTVDLSQLGGAGLLRRLGLRGKG